MKTKITEKNNKKAIFVSIIILIAIISVVSGGIFWKQSQKPDQKPKEKKDSYTVEEKIDYKPPTEKQIEAGEDKKEAVHEEVKNSPNLTITAAGINQNVLQVRVVINDIISNNGTCNLTLTNSTGEIIESEVSTSALPNASTCAGFDIDATNITSGKWTVDVSVSIDNNKLHTTKEIDLK